MVSTSERDWLAELQSSDESVRDSAAGDLRELLWRGLKVGYAGRGADDSFHEDIAQEATIRILDRLHQFEGRSKFTTWAMTVAVRLAVSEFRKKRFRDVSLEGLAGDDAMRIELAEDIPAPDQTELRAEVMTKLKSLVEGLSEKQRIATQALLDGMPVDVIAQKTENNRNAVYKLIHDARRRLKAGLEASGYHWGDIHDVLAGGV